MRGRRRSRSTDLRKVYRDNVDAVFAFFSYSVSREAAEDLTSATFERALRSWDAYDPARANVKTWIMAIARNLLTDHYRRSSVRRTVSLEGNPEAIERETGMTDRDLDRVLDTDELRHWLSALPEREQEVLALRFGADLAAREVAEILDLSEANVHQLASRGVRRLRMAIGD